MPKWNLVRCGARGGPTPCQFPDGHRRRTRNAARALTVLPSLPPQ